MESINSNQRAIYMTKSYKQQIKKTHPLYELFADLTIKSKNLYNLALYTERQYYFEHKKIISKLTLQTMLKETDAFKQLPSKTSQMITHQVYQDMNSFLRATNEYYKDQSKLLEKPRIPGYKDKSNGRNIVTFDYQQLRILDTRELRLPNNLGTLEIPSCLVSKQLVLKPHTESNTDLSYDPQAELIQLRIIPRFNLEFQLEFIYNEKIKLEPKQTIETYIASIDLGLDNFAAIVFYKPHTQPILINGKGLKSYNRNYNKKLESLKSQESLDGHKATKRIQTLHLKHQRYIETWMHKTSRFIVNQLKSNGIQCLVIGQNKSQKQSINLEHKTNQNFVQIPYQTFIQQLKYKCIEAGIQFIEVEESYTSGTSFLDNELPIKENYNKSRRMYRGLFVTNNGSRINADINAAYQILKKVPAFAPYIQALPTLEYNPIKINIS